MFQVDKQSLERLQHKLARELPNEAAKEGRAILLKAAKELKARVKSYAPQDTGALKRSLYVKPLREKIGEAIAADVRVKTGKKNAAKNRDGFYWRFHEYGTVKMSERPFVRPTLKQFEGELAKYFEQYREVLAKKFNGAL